MSAGSPMLEYSGDGLGAVGGVADQFPRIAFGAAEQIKAGVVTIGFVAVFYNVFLDLGYKWLNDANWSHGPIIPLFSLWIVYYNWERIKDLRVRGAWVGLPVMLGGLILYEWSMWGAQFGYLRPFSMMVCLLGVIVLLCGIPVMRYAWIAWLFLFFAIPLPGRLYFQLTNPLRRLAAGVEAAVLSMIPGMQVERSGSVLECYRDGSLIGLVGVEDACSGMRSTITLCALGVAVTFMSDRPVWHRLIMIAMCIPIATLCNMLRVLITCGLYLYADPKYASGTYHTVLGLLMLLVAFGLLSGLGWMLNNIVVEEHETGAEAASAE